MNHPAHTPHDLHLDVLEREARASMTRWAAVAVGLTILAFAAASLLDRWAFHALLDPMARDAAWFEFVKPVGSIYPWLMLAVAILLIERPRLLPDPWPGVRRAVLPLLAAVLAGAAAELLKLLFRRERPINHDGAYVFRPFDVRPWSTGGLDLPSSHAAVAAAGAVMLCYLFPRAWPVWILLAVGCCISRVVQGAHFLSAVVLGAAVGYVVARLLWRSDRLGMLRRARQASVIPAEARP